MKRTTTVAENHLKPTVHIDAVPELARHREVFKERERARKQTAAGEPPNPRPTLFTLPLPPT